MAKTKTDETEGRNGPSHEDIQMAVHAQLEWNQKRAELNGAIGKFRKGLKAQGISLGTLDSLVRMLEWTPEEVKADFSERQWYAEAMRLPVGSQLEMFGGESTPEPVRDQLKWFNAGYKNGLAGIGWPDEPPDGCPPECAQEYGKGHEQGSEIVRAAFLKRQAEMGPLDNPYVKDDTGPDPGGPTADEAVFSEFE